MQNMIDSFVQNVVFYLQSYGIMFGVFIIILESIIPALPLGIFIAFNMMAFGNITGFIVSWISTIIGCMLSYMLFRFLIGNRIDKKQEKYIKLNKVSKSVKSISFPNLVLIVALPFSPAFLINIACGISKVNFKKFIVSLALGKISIIYFWGFISKSLLESITDFKTIITIVILLIISYVLSKIVNRKLRID